MLKKLVKYVTTLWGNPIFSFASKEQGYENVYLLNDLKTQN